jgi:hypothetical protein
MNRLELRKFIIDEMKTIIQDDALFRHEDNPGILDKIDIPGDSHKKHRSRHSYMARPQLYSIVKNASKIFNMLEDGQEIDDWMESHISQASEMIESVFRKLDYKNSGHKLDGILDNNSENLQKNHDTESLQDYTKIDF